VKRALLGLVIPFSIASSAHAQSSVTLFGLLDVGVSYVSNEKGGHTFKADDSIWTPSLWGIRGVEDLGGGYRTVFDLESQFAVNTGRASLDRTRTSTGRHSLALRKTASGGSPSASSTT
jgi:predicted porin